jgi:type IV secretion system protein VirB10
MSDKDNKDDKKKPDLGPFDESDFDLDEDFGEPSDSLDDFEDEEFIEDQPKVSTDKKKNLAIMIIAALFIFFMAYQLIMGGKKSRQQTKPKTETEEIKEEFREKSAIPVKVANEPRASIGTSPGDMTPSLDETFTAPPPPPPPPPTYDIGSAYTEPSTGSRFDIPAVDGGFTGTPSIGIPDLDSGEFTEQETEKIINEEMKRRIQAPMFIGGVSGGGGGSGSGQEDEEDPYPYEFDMSESTNFRQDSGYIGRLKTVILQGKVLDAVLETAINTDLPGKLRAIVSRDVYAEAGRRIMIPKGSRLIGTYDTQITFGQARVFIVWTRIIRPDGVDVILDGREDMIATDLLGRTGVYGDLDNRFIEIFGSSILLSTITVGFAVGASTLFSEDEDIDSTVGGDGDVVETGSVAARATRDAVEDLGGKVERIARDLIKDTPRITVDQGTKIKIFVNKDIHFPLKYINRKPEDGVFMIN